MITVGNESAMGEISNATHICMVAECEEKSSEDGFCWDHQGGDDWTIEPYDSLECSSADPYDLEALFE